MVGDDAGQEVVVWVVSLVLLMILGEMEVVHKVLQALLQHHHASTSGSGSEGVL